MCDGFELELRMRAAEQSRRKNGIEELNKRAKNAPAPKPRKPQEQVAQPDPVPA